MLAHVYENQSGNWSRIILGRIAADRFGNSWPIVPTTGYPNLDEGIDGKRGDEYDAFFLCDLNSIVTK
ncbi:hypothetical protein FOBRF1_005350 [Fusarium oxysporum]